MPIIGVEILKTTDENRKGRKQQKKKKQRQKGTRRTETIVKG